MSGGINAKDLAPDTTHVVYGLKPRPDGQVDIRLSYTQRMHILYFHETGGEGEYDYEKTKQAPDAREQTIKQFGHDLNEHIKLLTRDGIFTEEPIMGSAYKVRKRLTQLGRNLAAQIKARHHIVAIFDEDRIIETKED